MGRKPAVIFPKPETKDDRRKHSNAKEDEQGRYFWCPAFVIVANVRVDERNKATCTEGD
jgi:hypothetical protein